VSLLLLLLPCRCFFYLPIPGAELVAKNPPRLTALMSPVRAVANGRPTPRAKPVPVSRRES